MVNKKRINKGAISSFDFVKKVKIIPKSKLSQGHVEIILSFALFVGALIFLFLIINPFAEIKEVSIMGNIKKNIIDEVSLEIGKLSIITNQVGSCYNFNRGDYPGNYQEFDEGDRKYNIYFGEIFSDYAPIKEGGCSANNYSLGIYSKEKIIVYSKIQDFVSIYNSDTDYENLKLSWGIVNDFSFKFKDFENKVISELSVSRNIPEGLNVNAVEFPVRVINDQGKILELILNIRGW